MKKLLVFFAALLILNSAFAQKKPKLSANKQAVIQSVDNKKSELTNLSDEVWRHAEVAFQETKSSKALADYAESKGFKVERGVAEIPTAFVASYGSGQPVIGVLGEFDALPGISQKAQPTKEAYQEGGAGHGCGHNLFGVGSLGAALSIKELIEQGKLKGTIKFFGTPAEESGNGKVYMARAGLFNDLDLCFDWHPGTHTEAATQSSTALVEYHIEFFGKASHAAGDPWNGRSALDGLELFTDGINMLREHIKPSSRMHYVIQNGGDVPNVVPEYAKAWIWIRDSKREEMDKIVERMKDIAKGAALMAGVESKATLLSGTYEILVNRTGAEYMHRNLEAIGPITYTDQEIAFAKKIQEISGVPQDGLDGSIGRLRETSDLTGGGSTDTGDVSWVVPTIRMTATTGALNAPWHSWAEVACAGMSIGHKGMLQAAKAMGMTIVDAFENEKLRTDARAEFDERRKGHTYKAYLSDGPPPIKSGK
ncbi:MAG: amidohydrolase [Cyclobacteriaceae bacterium]|nr:amidohydrolase [Cyclobacteriaceae bacterium]